MKEPQWEQSQSQYDASTIILKIGKWRVGSVLYDSCTSKGDPKKYKSICVLPGIKTDLGHYEDQEEAKNRLIGAVKHWFREAE
jgi:hypothetical protein